MKMSRNLLKTEGGFVFHELVFNFGPNRVARRYVTDDMWKARFSDARSHWIVWNAVKGEGFKKPPLQGSLL